MEPNIKFDVALKKILLEGTLAWEYNPFHNYRLSKDAIYYKKLFHSIVDFFNKYIKFNKLFDSNNTTRKKRVITKIEYTTNFIIYYKTTEYDKGEPTNITYDLMDLPEGFDWSNYIINYDSTEEPPVIYQKGQLVDFITDEFDFDLNHPVQITPTYSYDNSVDLIINDGKSLPKIINSRFSAIGRNKYKIIDRNGNNDTNIYDEGEQFDIDTSLYKITSSIPEVTFGGIDYGGNLKVGNYHFYFKYSDVDGNESDFIALSGLISVFLGNTANSINTGFRNQNSNKKIRLLLYNLDEAYDYLVIYYSRATSEEFLNRTTEYRKILQRFKVANSSISIIDITGFENTEEVTFQEINQRLQVYDSALTQAIALNMLFLGNVTQNQLDHDYLSRLALYIIPLLDTSQTCNVGDLTYDYLGNNSKTYYNTQFIYNYTGYWDDEIYRFGVVFIRNNNTLTPVYNVRGLHLDNTIIKEDYDKMLDLNEDESDLYKMISYDEVDFTIDKDFLISKLDIKLENAKGVCYIPLQKRLNQVIGIKFLCGENIITLLNKIGIKGYFIVRLKRIPTTLCQAYTIGLESQSHTPMLPIENKQYVWESFLNKEEELYTYWNDEGRMKTGKGNLLRNDVSGHIRKISSGFCKPRAAICPDYDVNSPYLNSFFTGSNFTAVTLYSSKSLNSNNNARLYETENYTNKEIDTTQLKYNDIKVIGVEDSVKLIGIGDQLFSARAGEAEEAYRFEYVGSVVKKDRGGNNLLRGLFGPYLGITGYESAGDLINIKIPGYNTANLIDYFKIRYNDTSMFYPISNRIMFDNVKEDEETYIKTLGTCYRGDCYICKFTHRLNRNFTDPSTPTNDDIVDPSCWTHNMKFEDDVMVMDNLDKINLGDVNAVNLGLWVSFFIRSNINHSIRSIDNSQVDEKALIGNDRGFYPYHPLSAAAAYKLPEAGTYNKGFEASVGEQVFEELPIVPYYKDVFSTRIAYSNIQITSAFKNAYRVFPATHYRDYPITYGSITKIIEWNGDLVCVLEHGVYLIPINERAVAGEGSGGTVYINTSNVLPENPKVISDTFGSQWIDSIIKTPIGIYGVDTVARKIWKVDNNGMELISDFKVLKFLNDNISLTERELTPIIGIRNVKTHYNAFKHDVMFTFYDDLRGVDEVAWNLCWNELMNKWVTFYSWIPSFSENIYNSFFSFDRETSKHIGLLALNEKSEQNDLIYIDNTVMSGTFSDGSLNTFRLIGALHYDLTVEGTLTTKKFKWEIIKDPYNNYKYFTLKKPKDNGTYGPYPSSDEDKFYDNPILSLSLVYNNYVINKPDTITYDNEEYYYSSYNTWNKGSKYSSKDIIKDPIKIQALNKQRTREWKKLFDKPEIVEGQITKRMVYLLNIRVTPVIEYEGQNATFAEYLANKDANSQLTGGYIERTIAVIPKDHLEALSTDFWKHGLAGIIDIKEEIKPTNWYGKKHPFEFEFIVRDAPDTHKIFDNLVIISNKADPESFHYEIIGECYDFKDDKKNMYIRQEATKEAFQNSGYDIAFNDNYKTLVEKHRPIKNTDRFEKSTIFPLNYYRKDAINTIEDYYNSRPKDPGKNYDALSGSEVVYYKDLNEFRIWTHSKGVSLTNSDNHSRLRGNMHYKEDKWYVLIPSIRYVLKNEGSWGLAEGKHADKDKIPLELTLFCYKTNDSIDFVVPTDRGYTFWQENQVRHQEAKIKDKYIKIRIRYSGEDLAVISAIKTLYSISYA